MPTADEVRELLERDLRGAEIAVVDTTGGGDHFDIAVTSDRFKGLSRVDQHRLIHDSLRDRIGDGSIHAVAIRTKVPEDVQ